MTAHDDQKDDQTGRDQNGPEPGHRSDATRGERAANPPPPAEEALTSEDVHDSPQLPSERLRSDKADDD